MNIPPNSFKRALTGSVPQIGIWSMLCNPIGTEILAECGYDWLLIDTEHSPLEASDVLVHMHAAAGSPTSILARPAQNDAALIKRFLDLGVQTLLIPFVETPAEAEAAVAACRYPPKGIRGVSGASRASRYGRIPGYLQNADVEICVLVQVETKGAMAVIGEIARTEGVDGVFIGPSDLSASYGHIGNPGHPDVQQAIKSGVEQLRSLNVPAGILAPDPADAQRYIAWGFSFVAVALDVSLLSRSAEDRCAMFSRR